MNKTWILLRTQLIDFLPINEIKGLEQKKKRTTVMIGFSMMIILIFVCTYNLLIAQTLVQAGEQELIPAYMVSVSSLAIFFLTIFRSNGILFGCKDIDILFSLPIKNSEIIGSKFMFLYVLNFLIRFIFMIPGGIIWLQHVKLDILRFILFFLSTFFVPFIPMCLASIIGVIIVFISSYFKNKNIISLLLSFGILSLIGYGYIYITNIQKEGDVTKLGEMLASQITGLYPLSKMFLIDSKFSVLTGISPFILLSTAIFYLFLKIIAAKYTLLNSLSRTTSKYNKHTIGKKKKSPFVALYKKELGRFFSSYMAVLNTGLGVILLCLLGIFLFILSPQQFGQYIGIENMNHFLSDYAPIVVATMLSLSCPAASSISLEGKNIWILQSSPISVRTILNSKIAVNLTLHIVGYFYEK